MTDLRTDQPKLRLFSNLPNGYSISFGRGKFDDWCIYFQTASGVTYFPKDVEYFATLDSIGQDFGHINLYNDFVHLYNEVRDEKVANPHTINWIYSNAVKYSVYASRIGNAFAIMYAGMVAEENKEHKVLGKRIKRLGVYQVLVDREEPHYAADFSRGMKAKQLIVECEKRGF
jgi:hypothetical protein